MTAADAQPLWLASRGLTTGEHIAVHSPWDGRLVGTACAADADLVEQAITAAATATADTARVAPWQRQRILAACAERIAVQAEALAQLITAEIGKPIRDSRVEVQRAVDTFTIAAAEAVRQDGTWQSLAGRPRTAGHQALTRRFPIGPVALISPFNFPLNLVAHKVAPALAAGCPFILKPSPRSPLTALALARILAQAAGDTLPAGAWSVLPTSVTASAALINDPRLAALSFTGSAAVGWHLRAQAGAKHVILELGGNAACLVAPDWDLDDAVRRLVPAITAQSGQSCISVQRIFVPRSSFPRYVERLAQSLQELPCGDPTLDGTAVGPLVDAAAALRLESWIRDAVAAGARLICGGTRQDNLLEPALLTDVHPDLPLVCEEAFGPVAVIESYDDADTALAQINASRYGLQAGILTHDLRLAWRAWELLAVGTVLIGEVPTWRADELPYGGVKDSGCGREGVAAAIRSFTEERVLVLRVE